ncbi:MAG TPA: AsmA family protein, partial [Burkholderiaceae bacterium]|nr:AsmA family protein [Burkholderiaceae bacterium]
AGEMTGWRVLRSPLQNALQNTAGVPVQFSGRFDASLLWGPRLDVERITIGAGGGLQAPHLFEGRNVVLEWSWGALWRWRRGEPLRLRALQAGTLDLQLLRAADGRATWQLGRGQQRPKSDDERGDLPRVGLLAVNDGRIVVDDRITDTQLQIALQGREQEGAAGQSGSGYRATVSGRYRAMPLNLQLQSGSALPLLQGDEDDTQRPSSNLIVKGEVGAAKVAFDGRASALLGPRQFDGVIQFAGPSLAKVADPLGVTLPQTPAFELRGRLAHDAGVWHLVAERATIGASRLGGDFRYDTRNKPPRLSGQLSGPRLSLADLGPSIGAETGGTPKRPAPDAQQRNGRVLPQRQFDVPSLRAMDADVQVAVDELDFDTSAMASMRGLRAHVLLNRGVLELQNLKASVAGGQASGTTRLDSNANPPKWGAQVHFGGVDIAGWLRGARTPEGKQKEPASTNTRALKQQREQARQQPERPPPAYVTGVLEADFNLTGAGRSTAQILGSMDGRSDITLRDGTLSHLVTEALGLDIAQALGVVIRGDRPLPLRCARFTFGVNDGVFKVERGVLDNPDTTIRVGGSVNLRTEALGLVARARPKDVSPVSLRSPITITGTLSEPQLGVQGKRLTGRLLGAIALGSVFPPLALLPLFDPGEGEQADPCLRSDAAPPAARAASNAR